MKLTAEILKEAFEDLKRMEPIDSPDWIIQCKECGGLVSSQGRKIEPCNCRLNPFWIDEANEKYSGPKRF